MRHSFPPTWIAVMDSSVARFYALHHGDDNERRIDEAAPQMTSDLHRHERDVKSDRPGRNMRAAGAQQHHAFESTHDYHKLEKHDFVVDVARFLKAEHDAGKFERLAIVAPERTVGEMRKEADGGLQKAVWREIGKDLVNLDAQALWQHLKPELQELPGGG